ALCVLALPVSVSADGGSRPVYASDIQNGTYENVAVDSTSSMFRVVACTLTVTDEGMTAHMTLSGQGFGKLYIGRGAEAENEDESAFYLFGEDEEGRHTFDIPVEALDKPIPCAGWSIKREQWYDRDITFRADSLPDGAVAVSGSADWILWTAAALVAVAVVAVFLTAGLKRKKKAGGKA
ncbi:MAG: hypothetical protein K6G29_09920, partial [Clostridiales bacterium]|nr:hypothetical protein [Clostridiales bacterium]